MKGRGSVVNDFTRASIPGHPRGFLKSTGATLALAALAKISRPFSPLPVRDGRAGA